MIRRMMGKHGYLRAALLAACCAALCGCGGSSGQGARVVLETNMGDITLRLYDDTPLHRDNFLRLARAGYYDGLLCNRVAPGSTVQWGDPAARADGAPPAADTARYRYTIPAEIRCPAHFHKMGAVGMAREADGVNPRRESCAAQFYIVTGRVFTPASLAELHQFMADSDTSRVTPPFTPAQKSAYTSRGGAPHLDGAYTVFGEVVDGMRVVEALGRVGADAAGRPSRRVLIKRARVVE